MDGLDEVPALEQRHQAIHERRATDGHVEEEDLLSGTRKGPGPGPCFWRILTLTARMLLPHNEVWPPGRPGLGLPSPVLVRGQLHEGQAAKAAQPH